MCGIFGCAGPGINQQDIKMMKELGVISQLRGMDGAGIYQVRSQTYGKSKYDFEAYYKTSSPFNDLLDELEYTKNQNILNSISVDIIMGHVRAATKGAITTKNAHPFFAGHLVGMHNGTLKDHKYFHVEKTDSEMMFQDMARRGIAEVLKQLDKNSAYVVTIYDTQERCMFFAKNDKRPLAFAISKDRNVLYWASEKLMLQLILKRNGSNADYFSLKDNVVYRLRPARIDKANNGKMFSIVEDLNVPEPVKETQNALVVVSQQTPVRSVNEIVKDVAKELESKKEDKETKKDLSNTPSLGKVLPFPPTRKLNTQSKKLEKYEKGDTRQFHLFCDCGKDSLNLFDAYMCKQGAKGYPVFKPSTNTFECQICK